MNKPQSYKFFSSLLACVIALSFTAYGVHAQETSNPVNITLMPFAITTVKGDAQKFRAMHWINDGYSYGIKDLTIEDSSNKNANVSLEAHSIPNDYDNALDLTLTKENVGYVKTDYASFRKYYDGTGGTYYPHTTFSALTLEDDLKMDMQHMFVEIGSKTADDPGVAVAFERHSKDGRKSRLAWTAVKFGSVTRDIGPTWQDVEEVTDAVALKGNGEVAGFNVGAEQKFEFTHIKSLREEKFLSAAGGVSSDTKMRRQWQDPQTDLYTTTLKGDRWFNNDKNHLSLGYRYSNLENSELENLREYTAAGVPNNYSNPKSAINAYAKNRYNAHTTVGSFMSQLGKDLNFITKMKAEVLNRRGTSAYPHDTTSGAPDGIINTTDVSTTENKIYRLGENFSLRYNGISKTSLYSEVEMEQTRNWLTEERNSIAGQSAAEAGEQLGRETITHVQNLVATAGARYVPSKALSITTQVRHKLNNNDYDDVIETVYASGSKSAFVDAVKTRGDELTTKVSWKPVNRVEGVFRYKLSDTKYMPRVESQEETKSRGLSNVFGYDLNLQPTDPLFVTLSFSQDFSNVTTPAGASTSLQYPGFRSNSNNWLMATSYMINEKWSLNSSFQYTLIKNFNDVTSTLLPYAADSKSYDGAVGLSWSVNKSLTVSPHYGYYAYKPNSMAESGAYNAQVVWLDAKLLW